MGYYIGWKQGHSNDVRHGELPNSEFEYNSSTRNFRRTKDGSVQNCCQYDWDQVDLDWNHGDSVNVRITR